MPACICMCVCYGEMRFCCVTIGFSACLMAGTDTSKRTDTSGASAHTNQHCCRLYQLLNTHTHTHETESVKYALMTTFCGRVRINSDTLCKQSKSSSLLPKYLSDKWTSRDGLHLHSVFILMLMSSCSFRDLPSISNTTGGSVFWFVTVATFLQYYFYSIKFQTLGGTSEGEHHSRLSKAFLTVTVGDTNPIWAHMEKFILQASNVCH